MRPRRPPRPILPPTEPRGATLPPSWHRAIWDAYRAGYTQREIRIAFGIGRTTVERSIREGAR
jgi:hypothetical protein